MSTPEEIRYDGQQTDREDKRREDLESRSRMGGPEAPEDCETCEGSGILEVREGSYPNGVYFLSSECPKCLGSGVQA